MILSLFYLILTLSLPGKKMPQITYFLGVNFVCLTFCSCKKMTFFNPAAITKRFELVLPFIKFNLLQRCGAFLVKVDTGIKENTTSDFLDLQ